MAGKIKQSPKLPAETRRQQLLDSARKLFAKKGYRVTTTEEIARNAGLTKGALYFHFKTKEDILFDLVKHFASQNQAVFEEELGKVKKLSDLFRLMMETHHKCDCKDHWETVDIWIQAMSLPKIKRYLNNVIDEFIDAGVTQLKKSYRRSDRELRQLVVLVLGLHDGLSFIDMVVPSAVDLEAQVSLIDRLTKSSGLSKTGSRGRKQKKQEKQKKQK